MFTKEAVVFWQQCQRDQKLQGFFLLQRGSIMLNFSETQLLKRFLPIAMISLLVFAYKRPAGMTVLIVSTSQMSATFSRAWKRNILDNCFLIWCRKMRIKKRSAFSQNIDVCSSFHSLPSSPFHHSSSVIYSLLSNVKRVISSYHSSCIYHP
jgi:hypothetical protein